MVEFTILVLVLTIAAVIAVGLIPMFIARKRKHYQSSAITGLVIVCFIICMFSFALAGIAWVVALVWSLTTPLPQVVTVQGPAGPRGYQGDKGETLVSQEESRVPLSKRGTVGETN